MTWYSLCTGRDLPQCESCMRLIDRHPEDAAMLKSWISPQIAHGKCRDWMAKVELSEEDRL